MSDLSDTIDKQIGEIERLRDLHAETLDEHARERDRWAERHKALAAELAEAKRQRDIANTQLAKILDGSTAVLAKRDALRAALNRWSGDGALQTFEDRERFRKEARALIAGHTDQPSAPRNTGLTCPVCGSRHECKCGPGSIL